MVLRYQLSRGLAYLSIRHTDMRAYRVYLPFALTLASIALLLALPAKPPYLGKDGLLSSVLALAATLPGFYFAGLAAVATFGEPSMNLPMPNPAPVLDMRVGTAKVTTELTRRQFLSYLFSYLVLISFILCALLLAIQIGTPTAAALRGFFDQFVYGWMFWGFIKYGVLASICWLCACIVTTTLQGIYFLAERMHQP